MSQQQQRPYQPYAQSLHGYTTKGPRRLSDLSEVPTSDLGNADPRLKEKKQRELEDKIPKSRNIQRILTEQCVGIHQETSERRPIPGVTAAGVDSQQLINEIIADQEALNVATERYRQAAEAFHFWDTEIQKINGRMRTRERLSEVAGRNKQGD
ncbi:hypothetical protein ACHAPI_011477 [Fusarium lateritium]